MTIGAIILDIAILIAIVLIICGLYVTFASNKTLIITIIIATIIMVGIICFQVWYYSKTEIGQRAIKSQDSKLGDGIERVITVYDLNGKVIKTYEGKFDITYDSMDTDGLLFDDQNGKRHIIYYTTGTITVDEK